MATKLLNQRIKDVMCARKRAGKADITPTLNDLERTHILYVNAHFKPFAAIGYEYNKVRPQSGTVALNAGVTFSIPQFGDFFHDMVCRTRLSAFNWATQTTPLQSAALGAVFPFGSQAAPPTVGSVTNTYYNLVDAVGNLLVAGTLTAPANPAVSYRNLARYAEYPGNRLFRSVKFDVNGNPLDQYSDNIPTMLEKFCTPPHKRVGHDRLVGQEVPMTGYGPLHSCPVTDADAANTPAGIHLAAPASTQGLFDGEVAGGLSPDTALNGATLVVDFMREKKEIVNGPQTPKPQQPALEIWNKLRFWFNDDVRLSVPSVSIPFGQRFISIDLCGATEIIFEEPNLFLQTITETATVIGVDAGGETQYRTTRASTFTPILQSSPSGYADQNLNIERMELYINNIFVNPEVHDIFIKRIGFSLIRVYREHNVRTNQDAGDEKQLTQLKWPVEYIMMGLRPSWNTSASNNYKWRDWHRLTRMVNAVCSDAQLAEISQLASGQFNPGAVGLPGHSSSIAPVTPDQYGIPVPTVDTLTLTAHGITIYDTFNEEFFSAYMPYHYGGTALVTPNDPGAIFINFALFPRSYQPSGHLNISRARETFLKWTTSYVSSKTPCDVIAVAVAINFLLVTDGSAVLRYST